MPEWMDEDFNIIDDMDPEVWFVISAFLNNCTLDSSDVSGRIEDSSLLLLKAASKLCEELGLYYKHH